MKLFKNHARITVTLLFCFFAAAGPNSQSMAADYQKGVEAYIRGDFASALNEWTPLAEQGNNKALCDLGFMYSKGQGVTQNYPQAYAWYTVAASQGSEVAIKSRDIIIKEMSPGQLSEAQELTKQIFNKIHGGR